MNLTLLKKSEDIQKINTILVIVTESYTTLLKTNCIIKIEKMKIIMLVGIGNSTKFIYNALYSEYEIDNVLMTESTSKRRIVKRRIKNLGFIRVFNQLLFQVFIVKFLKIFSSKKYVQRQTELNLNGASIISSKVLNSTDALFINTHVGITPEYRGVHGGYWALRNNDKENFGVTVHLVDKGIDTGSIIYQDTTTVMKNDNFLTYPLYQYALAIPLLKQTLKDIENNELNPYKKETAKSKLYYHPTFTKYLTGLIFKGVK